MRKDEIPLLSSIYENVDKSDNFKIYTIEYFDNNKGPIAPHKHTFYEIVFILKGKGVHYIDSNKYTIQKGALFLLEPSKVHYWNQKKELKAYVMRFDSSVFHNPSFFENISIFETDFLQLENEKFNNINTQLQNLLEEFNNDYSLKSYAVNASLEKFLITIDRLVPSRIYSQKDNDIFTKLNDYIHENKYKIEAPNIMQIN